MSEYFPHTTYHIGKLGIEDIEKDVRYHHDHAFDLLGLKLDTSLDLSLIHICKCIPSHIFYLE